MYDPYLEIKLRYILLCIVLIYICSHCIKWLHTYIHKQDKAFVPLQFIACVSLISPNNFLSSKIDTLYYITDFIITQKLKGPLVKEAGYLPAINLKLCTFHILYTLLIINVYFVIKLKIVNGRMIILNISNLRTNCVRLM